MSESGWNCIIFGTNSLLVSTVTPGTKTNLNFLLCKQSSSPTPVSLITASISLAQANPKHVGKHFSHTQNIRKKAPSTYHCVITLADREGLLRMALIWFSLSPCVCCDCSNVISRLVRTVFDLLVTGIVAHFVSGFNGGVGAPTPSTTSTIKLAGVPPSKLLFKWLLCLCFCCCSSSSFRRIVSTLWEMPRTRSFSNICTRLLLQLPAIVSTGTLLATGVVVVDDVADDEALDDDSDDDVERYVRTAVVEFCTVPSSFSSSPSSYCLIL